MPDPNAPPTPRPRSLTARLRALTDLLSALELPQATVRTADDFDAMQANAAQAQLLLAHADALRQALLDAPNASAWDEADALAARALLLDLAQAATNFRWLSQAARRRVAEAQAAVDEVRGVLDGKSA